MVIEAYLTDALVQYSQVVKQLTKVQSLFRMRKQRKLFLLRFAELKRLLNMVTFRKRIFRFVQMAMCKIYLKKCKFAVRKIQSRWKGFRQCKAYRKCKRCFIMTQALYRRYICYKKQSGIIVQLLNGLRTLIPLLWHVSFTPLIERSRFWHFYEYLLQLPVAAKDSKVYKFRCGYVELGVYAREFERLYCLSNWPNSKLRHVTLKALIAHVGYVKSNSGTIASAVLPSGYSKTTLEVERTELYNTMKQYLDKDSSIKDGIFHQFGLTVTKKRKQSLCQALWSYSADNKLNHPSAVITLQIQSTREANQYSAVRNGLPLSLTAAVDRLARRIAAASSPLSVSDQCWLECSYGHVVSTACSEFAKASHAVVGRLRSEQRILVQRQKALEGKLKLQSCPPPPPALTIPPGSLYPPGKHSHRRSMSSAASTTIHSPLVNRKLIRRASKYNM